MPTSLIIALSVTLLYLLITTDKTFYKNWYLAKVKLDFVLSFMIGSWIFYVCSTHIPVLGSLFISLLFVLIILLFHFSLYYTSRHNKNAIDEGPLMDMVPEKNDDKGYTQYVDSFTGKKGTVSSRINEKCYLGKMNLGTEKEPNVQEVLVYSDKEMKEGDTFVIKSTEGGTFVAELA